MRDKHKWVEGKLSTKMQKLRKFLNLVILREQNFTRPQTIIDREVQMSLGKASITEMTKIAKITCTRPQKFYKAVHEN